MKFSVIIPTYNDWQRLMKCLNALEKQSIEEDQFEIIVVDNSETGIVPGEIHMPGKINLIHEPEPGSYAARNRGAEAATGEVLAFTDSDCIPDPDWLSNAAICFSQSRSDLVGGKIEIFQNGEGNRYGYLYERITAFPQHKHVPAGKGVTANLFVRKSVFDELGGFNATIKSGGDWEFTLRCTEVGYDMVYCEEALVLHPARSLTAIFKKQRRLVCGGVINTKEKYGYSYLRIMASHLKHLPKYKRVYGHGKLNQSESAAVYTIEVFKYLYRAILYGGLVLRLINPYKVRE